MPRAGSRTRLRGIVVSDRMDKSVVVTVERRVRHPLYKKYVTLRKKYAAHDEGNRCRTGDRVEIVSTRPLSKTKRWAVCRVLDSQAAPAEPSTEEASR
jgi:small subunit ribosomal protein S17